VVVYNRIIYGKWIISEQTYNDISNKKTMKIEEKELENLSQPPIYPKIDEKEQSNKTQSDIPVNDEQKKQQVNDNKVPSNKVQINKVQINKIPTNKIESNKAPINKVPINKDEKQQMKTETIKIIPNITNTKKKDTPVIIDHLEAYVVRQG